jgi:ferredoxin-NADP reductase
MNTVSKSAAARSMVTRKSPATYSRQSSAFPASVLASDCLSTLERHQSRLARSPSNRSISRAVILPSPSAMRRNDLQYFCGELVKAARAGAGFLSVDGAAARENAALAELIHRPSARTAMPVTAPSESGVAARAAGASSPLRLFDDFNADLFWRRGKLRLRCAHIVEETTDVKTFHFAAEPPKWFVYRPGQFLTLELPFDGKTVRRSYTISSSPSRPHMLTLTVKRVEGGLVSNWLHDELRVGDSVFADGPNGKFGFTGEEAGPYLFISGGSGITPVMAMSRWLHDTAPDADIRFLHFARTPKDLVFERELRMMESRMPGFRCEFVCTRAETGGGWTGPTGHASLELLRSLIPDFESRQILSLRTRAVHVDDATDSRRCGLRHVPVRSREFRGRSPSREAGGRGRQRPGEGDLQREQDRGQLLDGLSSMSRLTTRSTSVFRAAPGSAARARSLCSRARSSRTASMR